MFKRVTIIGVGLIGGSLALALKQNKLAKEIVGCGKIDIVRARGMGLIDEAYTRPAMSVEGAELIVLASPLSTYGPITRDIKDFIEPGAILTDVGSVKDLPSNAVLDELPEALHPEFVPGHPIAGIERSGPEAAFGSLFKDKRVILTPGKDTSSDAVNQLEAMWQQVGARPELMDAAQHDSMYAHVSHNVQLLASAYGVMFALHEFQTKQVIKKKANQHFQQFIRLAGSDTRMWQDIFLANSKNIMDAIELFLGNWHELMQLVDTGNYDELSGALEKERQHWIALGGEVDKEIDPLLFDNSSDSLHAYISLLPTLITAGLLKGLWEQQEGYNAGGGFMSFTRHIQVVGRKHVDRMLEAREVLLEKMESYEAVVRELVTLIRDQNELRLSQRLKLSQDIYTLNYRQLNVTAE